MGNIVSGIRAWSGQNVRFEQRKPPKPSPHASAPTPRLHYIFSASSLLNEVFREVRDRHPEILDREAMVQFISLLFVLLQEKGTANRDPPSEMMSGRMQKVLRRLRMTRHITVDMLVHSHGSIERAVREENLLARFNLAWTEATGQPIHRERFQLRIDSWRNRFLAQAMCRALVAITY